MSDFDLDPELAALLDDTPVTTQKSPQKFQKPDLMASSAAASSTSVSEGGVDLSVTSFAPIGKFFEDKPSKLYDSPDYYKKVLGGEGQAAARLHGLLSKYLACKDPKDRGVFRQQIISAYWDFAAQLAAKTASPSCCSEKKAALRFGLLLPSLLTPEQKTLFATIVEKNETGEPVYYLDEWFNSIAHGRINPSGTDEVKASRKDDSARFVQLLNKAEGKLQSAENLLRAKSTERLRAEDEIRKTADAVFQHEPLAGISGARAAFTDGQKRAVAELGEMLKKLLALDKELNGFISDCSAAEADVRSLKQKVEASGGGETNLSGLSAEFDTVRQMAKMTCGRQGNHFPVLTREYFHSTQREIGTRENVLETLRWIESVDVEAFCRVYKSQLNRIPPFVILIPSYGDTGFCWEPFDRYNRVTSRGRIAVPMYAKSLKVAVLTAVADLRWQVAKEKASYYWMEEGLTGNYYQWYQAKKLKGDLKDYFINDYLLWMLKESEGIQKLDKEVRGIFWRYMPFSKEVKEKLKPRALVYQELCQRDLNREMSDGY